MHDADDGNDAELSATLPVGGTLVRTYSEPLQAIASRRDVVRTWQLQSK
jgi:hypothetical protein